VAADQGAAIAPEDCKFWFAHGFVTHGGHVTGVGPIYWPDDMDSWVVIDGVRHEVPAGRRLEVAADGTVSIKELRRGYV
jgi:hypothetical protein